MTYKQIWEYVYEHFDINAYWTPEELIYDVKEMFRKTNSYFPPEAEDLIKERYQYRREYQEMQAKEDEAQMVADMLGSGEVMTSITDDIIQGFKNPEIMGIDLSELATTREPVVPPEIVTFAEQKQKGSFVNRVKTWFGRLFRRGE